MKDSNKDIVNQHIVDKLKEFRKQAGYNQDLIAMMLGVTRTSYINIEKNRQHLSTDKVYILACVFNKNIEDFFPEKVVIVPDVLTTTKKIKVEKIITTSTTKKINL